MTIFIFGNPDLEGDNIPIKIIPQLQTKFSQHEFKHLDPNEDWDVPENLVIIDTILDLDKIKTFDSLDIFANAPRVSLHGFDALMNLKWLQKLGKIKQIKIIGLPPMISETEALKQLKPILQAI